MTSLFSTIRSPYCKLQCNSALQIRYLSNQNRSTLSITQCISTDSSNTGFSSGNSNLKIGSAIILIEAPKLIKTASPIPSLRVNSGLVKQGDVGRIVARKPKDVWAVRLAIGTYLIDGKYFKALELDE